MAPTRWFSPAVLVLVVLGGVVGVAARAVLTLPWTSGSPHPLVVPAVTLAVNLVGSALLGLLTGALHDRMPMMRAFFGTGVLGGFTTYSAFAVHVVTTAGASPVVGLLLAAVSLFGGMLAAALGLRLGEGLDGRRVAEEGSR